MSEEKIVELSPIHDHHSHVSLYAAFAGLPDLSRSSSKAEALELLRELPRDRLSLVKGWRTDRLSFKDSELAGMPPALLVNSSLHGFAATPAAAEHIGALWPELAASSGDPGWGERNLPALFEFYVKIAGLDEAKLLAFMRGMEAIGIGSLEDMTLGGEEALDLIRGCGLEGRVLPWASLDLYRRLSPKSRSGCLGVKLFLDGSIGAKSAALDAPFSDGSEGSLLYSDEELGAILLELVPLKTGIAIHAIGHRAIEQALRRLELLAREGMAPAFARLEHAQFISLAQARRCKELGLILSMQPNFNSDSIDYSDRLIPRHCEENDPFRMLIDEAGFVPGEDLVFGSDGMPHGPEAALSQSLFPARPGQALGAEELMSGYGKARGAAAAKTAGAKIAFAIDRRQGRIERLS